MLEDLEQEMHRLQRSTKTLFRFFAPLHNLLRHRSGWYYRWHLRPYHRHVHYSALTVTCAIIAIIVSGSFYVSTPHQTKASGDPVAVSGKGTFTNTSGDLDFNAAPYQSNVTIDNVSKDFAGYAWSTDLGWVAFGTTDNDQGPVHVDGTSGIVSGKAKILNVGDYIDFAAAPHNSNVTINTAGDFAGYAWTHNFGWVNFSGVTVPGISFANPNAPSNVRAYDVSDRDLSDYALVARWQQPLVFDAANFQAYLVERSTDGVTYTQQASTTSTAYFDTNVTASQLYYYRIKTQNKTGSTDTSEVVSATPTGRYTTAPNLVSGPTAAVSPTAVTITWATDRACSSFVQINEGNLFVSEQGQTEQTTSHEVKVVGLRSQRSYTYKIRSTDIDGNILTGNDTPFTTANTPSVYDFNISNITQTSAIINFKSTAVANFTLYYGETANFGTTISETSGNATTNHSIAIDELKPGQMYFFRVVGDDADGNELRSENSFSTLPMPAVSDFGIEPVADAPSTTLKVSWTTNVPTSTVVKFSASGSFFQEKATSELVTDHEILIPDLADSSLYTIYAAGRDQFGNIAESNRVTYDTPNDTRPPKISEIVIESSNVGNSSSKAQIAVSWKTDEPANSQIEYSEGISGTEYTRKTTLDATYTNHHLVIISDLDPGKPYHLRVVSTDLGGNTVNSGDNTVITGEVSKSALQIILNTMQNIFGWMGKLIK